MWFSSLSRKKKLFIVFFFVDLCVAAWIALCQLPALFIGEYVRHDGFGLGTEWTTWKKEEVQANKVLFFNRVPKTGSEMMALLVQWLQDRNNFKLIRLEGNDRRRLDPDELEELCKEITKQIHQTEDDTYKAAFDRHVYFFDVENCSALRVAHVDAALISLIRDPIEKAVSRFYYKRETSRRNKDQLVEANGVEDSSTERDHDYEECVKTGRPECQFLLDHPYDLTIPYFCGHHPSCQLLGNEWALEQAKANVERHYKVVGVLEHLNMTLATLELHVPEFFAGVQQVFFHELDSPKWNWNKKRPRTINADVISILKRNLTMEYQFYEFVKQRLFRSTTL